MFRAVSSPRWFVRGTSGKGASIRSSWMERRFKKPRGSNTKCLKAAAFTIIKKRFPSRSETCRSRDRARVVRRPHPEFALRECADLCRRRVTHISIRKSFLKSSRPVTMSTRGHFIRIRAVSCTPITTATQCGILSVRARTKSGSDRHWRDFCHCRETCVYRFLRILETRERNRP